MPIRAIINISIENYLFEPGIKPWIVQGSITGSSFFFCSDINFRIIKVISKCMNYSHNVVIVMAVNFLTLIN